MIFKKILSWLAVILWMAFIFYLSAQPATQSSELSLGITEFIADIIEVITPFVEIDNSTLHLYIRKLAHFFAYFTLTILLLNALKISGATFYSCIVWALSISVIYAILDEVHQLYVPGRVGNVRDVVIDSAGAVVVIVVYLLLSSFRKRKLKEIS